MAGDVDWSRANQRFPSRVGDSRMIATACNNSRMQMPRPSARLADVLALCVYAGIGIAAEGDPSLIREQKTVIIDGKPEIWRLQWGSKPVPICGVGDRDVSLTCSCSGFAYGEQAPLALVRTRSNGETETLELGPLFSMNNPVVGAGGGRAILRRWAPAESGSDTYKCV
jgi:hypothetical protein